MIKLLLEIFLKLIDKIPFFKKYMNKIEQWVYRVSHKDALVPSVFQDFNRGIINEKSRVKIEGVLLPYRFFKLPNSFSSTKMIVSNIDGLTKTKKKNVSFSYSIANIPITWMDEEKQGKHLVMLYPLDVNFDFKNTKINGLYETIISEQNKGIPVLIDDHLYHNVVGKKVACYGRISLLDKEIQSILIKDNSKLINELNNAYFNRYNNFVKGIQFDVVDIKIISSKIKINGKISYCYELKFNKQIKNEVIEKEIKDVLTRYFGNKYSIISFSIVQQKAAFFLIPSDKIYVVHRGRTVGFYVDIDLSDEENAKLLKEELVNMMKYIFDSISLEYEISFSSEDLLIM